MSSPLLAIVLVTDTYDTIRGVIAALNRQQSPDRVEIVIALPHGAARGIRHAELSGFARTVTVPVDAVVPLAPARAAAIRAAAARFVFIGETHTYAEPGFVDAIAAAFDDHSCAAVVPAVVNANPQGLSSWVAYTFDYASWGPHRKSGWISDPLTHNVAYRRDVLMSLGDRLAAAVDGFEEAMWPELTRLGHRAWFAAEARLQHLNVGTPRGLLLERLACGATLGASRAARWTRPRRALYALASPLLVVVLAVRALRGGIGAVPASRVVPVVFGVLLSAMTKVAGEVAGYAGLKLTALQEIEAEYEIHKVLYAGRSHG
jgi:hypothetical protein